MKVIVLPDIHGRNFWKSAIKHVDECDRVVFLGDYFDPYDFEHIRVVDAIDNFKEILSFVKDYPHKAVVLLGNHDMPYFSEDYRALSSYHCRWSREWHGYISCAFDANRELFKIAHVEDDILFTHAGCSMRWLKSIGAEPNSLSDLVTILNALPLTDQGLRQLFMVSRHRGGWNEAGSCVWADVDEMVYAPVDLHFAGGPVVKQVFGHSLQVKFKIDGGNVSGDPITTPTLKMLDNRCAYLIDTSSFTHEVILDD